VCGVGLVAPPPPTSETITPGCIAGCGLGPRYWILLPFCRYNCCRAARVAFGAVVLLTFPLLAPPSPPPCSAPLPIKQTKGLALSWAIPSYWKEHHDSLAKGQTTLVSRSLHPFLSLHNTKIASCCTHKTQDLPLPGRHPHPHTCQHRSLELHSLFVML
jgi:hypothetical protein